MSVKIPTSMLAGVASTTPMIRSAADLNKVLVLDSAGGIPTTYIDPVLDAHQWRYTGNFAVGTSEVVVDTGDGWEQANTTPQGVYGSAMSVTEGVFTFPKTGLWLVTLNAMFARNTGNVSLLVADLFATKYESSGGTTEEVRVGQGVCSVHSDNLQSSVSVQSLLDVTNTSHVKVKTKVSASSSGADFKGNTTFNCSYFTFLRVAPT